MEEWKNLTFLGFPQHEISSTGRVLSLNYRGWGKTKEMSLYADTDGYLQVTLNYKGKRKTLKVHRLVAMAFIDNPRNKPEVNHKDLNRQNCNVSNLEWCTNLENSLHSLNARGKRKII